MLAEHYSRYPYPDTRVKGSPRGWRYDNAPRRDNWPEWFSDNLPGKRVLVVGCGTFEAVVVAAQEGALDVVGVDTSSSAVSIAASLAEKNGVHNLRLVCADLVDYPDEPFDAVLCTGVLHHQVDPGPFVAALRRLCRPGAVLRVMVYGDVLRSFIPPFCGALRLMMVKADPEGIGFVRHLISTLPFEHPVRVFFETSDRSDASLADLFLNPYFKQYGVDELIDLMAAGGFRFKRVVRASQAWERSPIVAERLKHLSEPERQRVGQVLDHQDARLTCDFI